MSQLVVDIIEGADYCFGNNGMLQFTITVCSFHKRPKLIRVHPCKSVVDKLFILANPWVKWFLGVSCSPPARRFSSAHPPAPGSTRSGERGSAAARRSRDAPAARVRRGTAAAARWRVHAQRSSLGAQIHRVADA